MYIINENVLDEIRDRVDLVDLISGYVNLKKSGANYMGLCPFHNEKTPSFSVSPSKQIFKCFGCGEGGDVISFIMKKENLGFREAVEFLAEKYNITLEKYEKGNKEEDKRNLYYEINKEAALFYYNNLKKSNLALSYLFNRHIDTATITKYGLGYAKDDWEDLKKHLLNKGYKEDDLIELDLISKSKKNTTYDRFRNRIMFPIINSKNKVIGFGGRVLDNSKPKYLNTKDTPIFHKGKNLFNLNIISKESDREKIILVEGYMDVISLYKSGINYTTASLGTSLTNDQAKIIKRYTNEVYICYDGDFAGINATQRAIDIFLSVGISPKIISLKDGLDPDEYIEKYGKFDFEAKVKSANSYLVFKIDTIKSKFDLNSSEGLSKFSIEAAKIFARIKNPIERDVYLQKFSSKYNISISAINNYINYIEKNNKIKNKKVFNKKTPLLKPKDGREKAEIQILSYAMLDEQTYRDIKDKIDSTYFKNLKARIVFEELDKFYKNNYKKEFFLQNLISAKLIDDEFASILLENKIEFYGSEKIIEELINTLEKSKLQEEKDKLLEKIDNETFDGKTLIDAIERLNNINKKLIEINEGI